MRNARGRRRVWRAARRAAEEAQDRNGVGETRRRAEEAEGEMVKKQKRETNKTVQRKHSAHSPAPARNGNSSISSGSTITTPNTNMKERIWPNRVANRTVSQPLHPGIGASLHNEHVISVQEEFDLHLEFYQ